MKRLGGFSVTPTESRDFARTSGDFNPLHLDPVAARRTRFGQTLIHGVCGTIKALDVLLQEERTNVALLEIRVKYSKPVSQGTALVVFGETTGDQTRLEVFAEGSRCQIIELELAPNADVEHFVEPPVTTCRDSAGLCDELAIEACKGLTGAVELLWDDDIMHALFPHATRCLPKQQLATLLASTQIVGMRCPGLHSIFAQLDMRFCAVTDSGNVSQLEYTALSVDERIDRVELAVSNAFTKGTIEAFFRPPPTRQADFQHIAKRVASREFSKQNALVIGASRGLGEVITKVLAAGGANVMMTYSAGKDDATRVSAEIGRDETTPSVCFYDVLDGSLNAAMAEFCSSVTHIYYLASPLIARGDSNRWNPALFSRYCAFYVEGLATLLQHVQDLAPGKRQLQLFIPSSVFLDTGMKGYDEYIAAKAAAEAYTRCYEKTHPNWRVAAPRLPRLHTDQTSSVKDNNEQMTLDVMIEQLRKAFDETENSSPSEP